MKTIVKILCFFALAIPAFAQTTTNQTTISENVTVDVYAGQAACQASAVSFKPCDNTIANPLPSFGVFTTSGTPCARPCHANPGPTAPVVAVNGVINVPVTAGYDVCLSAGDLVGDIDGSGYLSDMGNPSSPESTFTVPFSQPASYVGFCQGSSATVMVVVVQPGYLYF